ncbi:hypothetical protein AAV94_10975 [Lampropedia cohaerens]|uniref:Major facilitator superfamily (MFS) profile domain-containing protein n=2 Tax=Lampropedia cohaerens TaxID=1610491 RepID=A0A0U1PXW1_9BURK|nr:MFS transporter [Lampropedia cohaerens]KKW67359.1 hypothetical protein AAV94_10975 [Lampropedia cohaerens]
MTTSTFRLTPLLIAALLGTMAMMAYVAIIGPVVRQLGVPELVAGVSMAIGGVFWMLLARPWGRLSDRMGRKPILLAGLSAFALAYAVLALYVDMALRTALPALLTMGMLVGTRALIGAFYAAVPPTAAAAIADNIAPLERQQAMAKLGSATALGMVAGPAIVSTVSAHGLQWGFYATALLPMLGSLILLLWLPWQPAPRHGTTSASTQRPAALKLFDPRLRLAMATALTAMMTVSIAQVSIGFFAMDRLSLDADTGARVAGHVLTSVGVALILAQQCVIRLPGIALERWIVAGASIAALGYAGTYFVGSALMLTLTNSIGAFGMGFVFPSFQAMAANAVEPHEQGAAAGSASAAQGLGMVIGPIVGTLLYTIAPGIPYAFMALTMTALAIAVPLHSRRPAH